jgi:hypothetical protein
MATPTIKEHNTGGGGIGLQLNSNNELKDGTNGVKIVANFTNMIQLFEERRPVSLRLGAYWIMNPVIKNEKGYVQRFPAQFEHLVSAGDQQFKITKYILIHEENFIFDFSDVNYSKEILLPEPPQRNGFVLANSIMVGYFDVVYLESSLEDYADAFTTFIPKKTGLQVVRGGTSGGFRIIEIKEFNR